MEERKTTCACGPGCGCSCGCGWPRGHWMFRIILAIVILLGVFWVGVKMGELREAYGMYGWGDYGYGYHTMMYGGGYGGNGYGGGYGGASGSYAPTTRILVTPNGPVTSTAQ